MGREEQAEEREVLDSIFPDEIRDITESSYAVLIALDLSSFGLRDLLPAVATDGDDSDSDGEHEEAGDDDPIAAITLTVSYPNDYPDVGPDLSLAFPPSDKPRRLPAHLLSFPDDATTLLSQLQDEIMDNLGTAMIFTLVSALKENAENLVQTRVDAIEAAREAKLRQAEEAENAKFAGEKVTTERFIEWREKFRGEMQVLQSAQEAEQKRVEDALGRRGKVTPHASEESRLTGRQLWDRGLVSAKEDDEGDVGIGKTTITSDLQRTNLQD